MLELQTHLCDNIKTQTMKCKVAFVIKRSDSVSLTHPNMLNPEKIMCYYQALNGASKSYSKYMLSSNQCILTLTAQLFSFAACQHGYELSNVALTTILTYHFPLYFA